MKTLIIIVRTVIVTLCFYCYLSFNDTRSVLAQVNLTNYTTYLQNFNTLTTSATQSAFINNSTLPGWYLQHESYNLPFYGISANDGSNTTRNFYSLGTQGSTDRALGGMATDVNTGSGYIGFRVRNNTGATIRNFEISYTMEQWYNSGNEAQFDFSYTTKAPGTAITSLLENTATWVNVDELDAVTPSTSSPVGRKDGNADVHRIVKRFTINEINLQPNQEIMLRWQYITVNATNGNGLAIDDVSVTPQINVFYAANSGDFENKATWARNQNGTGGGPTDFSLPNQVFHITKGGGRPLRGSMNMTGNNSKVVLGDGVNPIDVRINPSSAFPGRIDVENNATLIIENTSNPVLGNLAENSTVVYSNPNPNNIQTINAPVYGNLKLSGKSKKTLSTNILVNGDIILDDSHVEIGNYNIALHKSKSVQGGNENAYIKTNGTGSLILTVPRTGTEVTFPVGNSTYNPIALKQSAAGAEDEFKVRVIDGIYEHYNEFDVPVGVPVTRRAINRTWLLEEVTPGGSDLSMKLFWEPGSELSEFNNETAHISHYENNQWDEGEYQSSELLNNLKYASRSNIQTFSPFSVMSYESSLPVSFIDFSANTKEDYVLIEWKTSSENNNDYFTLESSPDAKNFTVMGRINGSGNTGQIKHYQFNDYEKLNNERYYRLKQTDFDGRFTYSNTVMVNPVNQQKLSLYPSPTSDIIHIIGNAWNLEHLEVKVLDIYSKNYPVAFPLINSANRLTLDMTSLPPNTYLLKIKNKDEVSILKFIKI